MQTGNIKFSAAAVVFLTLLGVAIYAHTLEAPFVFDDETHIVQNESLRDISKPERIGYQYLHRYLTYWTFALNYHFGKLDVFGFHATNLGIHILTGILVYFLALFLFKRYGDSAEPAALLSALIFVVHPVQTQAVIYVVQRATLLAALFYLASLLCYFKYRFEARPLFYPLSLLFAIAAFFSKQNAYTLPFAILLCEIFLSDDHKDKNPLALLRRALPYFLLLAVVFVLVFLARLPNHGLETLTRAHSEVSRADYAISQISVIHTYIRLLFLPIEQHLDYAYPVTQNFWEPMTLASFFLLITWFVIATWTYSKNRLLSFGVFWFFLTLSLESSFLPIKDLLVEQRLYLPLFGFAIGLSSLMISVINNKKKFIWITALLTVALAYLTYNRGKVWQSEIALWEESAVKAPHNGRAWANLGKAYGVKGEYAKAVEMLSKGAELTPAPDKAQVYRILGTTYLQMKNPQAAITAFEQALEIVPDFDICRISLAEAYIQNSDFESAIQEMNFLKEKKRKDLAALVREKLLKANPGLSV